MDSSWFLISHYFDQKTLFRPQTNLFVELHDGMYVPFLVLDCQAVDQKTSLVHLSDEEDLHDSPTLPEKFIFMLEQEVIAYCAEDAFLRIEGFHVYIHEYLVGIATDCIEMKKGAKLLVVHREGKSEAHLPFHKDLIVGIDTSDKKIVLNLPEDVMDVL